MNSWHHKRKQKCPAASENLRRSSASGQWQRFVHRHDQHGNTHTFQILRQRHRSQIMPFHDWRRMANVQPAMISFSCRRRGNSDLPRKCWRSTSSQHLQRNNTTATTSKNAMIPVHLTFLTGNIVTLHPRSQGSRSQYSLTGWFHLYERFFKQQHQQ